MATGFGTVSRNILEALYRTGKYEIDIFGINHFGDPHRFPYRIWPAGIGTNDPYGRQKFCNMIQKMDFDILFFLQDTFILDFLPELLPHLTTTRTQPFKSICYYPIDGEPKPEWINNINYADYKVAYSEFGRQESIKRVPSIASSLQVIPHGANVKDFFVMDPKQVEAFKAQYFGPQADKFIIMNVNRNQQRKDIPRTLQAFKLFKEKVPNSILYLHMAQQDQGWNLPEVCRGLGLSTKTDVIFPENFGPNQGYPLNIVNALYNCADVLTSTTLGEGFGLCLHPETNVHTVEGVKCMNQLTITDKVLSHDGTYNNVEHIMSRDFSGKLYEITTWLSNIPVKSSPEHGFYVYKDNKFVWKRAELLKVGDSLLFPKKFVESNNKLNILDLIKPILTTRQLKNLEETSTHFRIVSNFKKKEEPLLPKEISITPSLMRLFGLYLAEGSISTSKLDSICFSFHKDETNLIDFVGKELKTVFGLDTIYKDHSKREGYNGQVICFYSSILARLFYILFGSKARSKKIHSELLNQPKENLKELLYGEFLGDGSYSKTSFELSFSTVSKDIAYSLRTIMARLGVLSSVRTSRVEYKVNVSGFSKELLLRMFNLDYPELDRSCSNEKCLQLEDYLVLPIKSIKEVHHEGKLVDIQVANTNNFVAENVVVHNSWLEAMATKTPILMPNNTMLGEFISEDKGYLMKSGTTPNLYTILPHDNEVLRPLVDVEDMVDKLLHIYYNKEEAKAKAENAYKWIHTEMNWQGKIAEQWIKVFDTAAKALVSPVSVKVPEYKGPAASAELI